uniref:PH domain-containing protein n=1 Tax=Angiostrongylus cantonensis TaxID=6313 RepID=A0A0K0D8K9_ANGCA
MDSDEEHFWLDVIEKYLSPLTLDPKEQERVRAALIELRNKVVSTFFMVNTVFIIIILVLQIQKDCLHIEWPIGPKFNHSVRLCNGEKKEEVWMVTRLQLEPLGLVFLVFFMSILIIQFIAMLCHRFGTLAHIIASTELFCFRKTVGKLSEDELVVQNAVEIARELQAIRGVDEKNHEDMVILSGSPFPFLEIRIPYFVCAPIVVIRSALQHTRG